MNAFDYSLYAEDPVSNDDDDEDDKPSRQQVFVDKAYRSFGDPDTQRHYVEESYPPRVRLRPPPVRI